ncbi:MAG: DoxX family protein [Chloroflexi bacterium]|nr:DoxX family protein [Chloroflexota bacterium]
MIDIALLVLRLIAGSLLAGHGSQKLFGLFGGHGIKGTAGWLESLGMRPGAVWAGAAGTGEFGGGVLIALGALSPLGSILAGAAMAMAWAKVHAGKPIWVSEGGAEMPVMYLTTATAVMLAGPGKYSVDHLLGIKIPAWMTGLAMAGAVGSVIYGKLQEPPSEEAMGAVAA